MLDPKELKKAGFGAFAALFNERWAARHPTPSTESSQAGSAVAPDETTPAPTSAPTVPNAVDGAVAPDAPPSHA